MEVNRVQGTDPFFANMLAHLSEALIFVDTEGRIIQWNVAAEQLYGWTAEEVIGKPFIEILQTRYHHTNQHHALQEVLQTGRWSGEVIQQRKDGTPLPIWSSVSTVKSAEGQILGLVGINRDLTPRKQADEALRQSEETYRYLFANHPHPMWIYDLHTLAFLEVNEAAIAKYGYTRAEFLQMTIQAIRPPEELPLLMENLAQERQRLEYSEGWHHCLKDGRVIDVSITSHTLQFHGHEAVLVIAEDITTRKQAEQAHAASQRRFQALIEHAPDGIALLGIDGKLRQVTPSTQQILGYTLEEAEGQDPASFTHPDDLPALLTLLSDLIQNPGKVVRTQYRFRHQDGSWRWLDSTISNLLTEPTVEAILFNFRDITERQLADETLRASEARFATVFNASPIAIAITRMNDNHLMDVNPAWEALTGWAKEDALGHSPTDLDIWLDPLERERMVQLMKEQGMIHGFEFKIKHKSGKPSSLLMSAELVTMGDVPSMLSLALDITAREQAERELQQRTEDLTLINALNDAVNRGEDLEGITEVFARETRRVFGCQDAALYLLSPDSKYLEMQSTTLPRTLREIIEKLIGRPIPKIQIPLREDGYFKQFLAQEQGTIISDPEVMQQWIEEFTETTSLPQGIRGTIRKFIPKIYTLLDMRSVLTMPLISFERTIGLLDMSSQHLFTEEDLQRIRNISFQITAVILRKQAERRVWLQLKRMDALHEIDRAINSSLDMRVSLTVLLGEVLSQLNVDAASILILNASTYILEYVAGKGFHTTSIRQTRVRLGEGVAGRVGLERKLMHIPNLADPALEFKRPKMFTEEAFVEYYGVPLIVKGNLKGVLEIFHRTPLTSDPDWENYLETLAGQAAIAIDNAQLFEGVQRSNLELSTAYDATIEGWSHALDLRDKETEGHSQRVTEMTLHLAQEMGISQEDMVQIRRGALLHDIGKLGVPDQILLKPGKLTDEEWVIMRQHPTFALEMLLPIAYLRLALDIPYCHHEKWDGTGYPRGLKGDAIPLAARIFAVVDVWDALSSDRPYRAGWPTEKIREYILEQSGTHFDPQVVEVFIPLMDQVRF